MKLLLINCPVRENAAPNCIPTGLGIIARIAQNAGHEVTIWDLNAMRWPKETVALDVVGISNEYDFCGISGLITTYSCQKFLIDLFRAYSPKTRIVCGGGASISNPGLMLKAGANIVINGEGEQAILNILSGKYIDGCFTEPIIDDLDALPNPAWHLIPMETYLQNPIWGGGAKNCSGRHPDMIQKRSINVITSRGCPFDCNYCFRLFGRKYRQRGVDNVIAELKALKSAYEIDFAGFLDDNLCVNRNWVLKFCEELRFRLPGLIWGCHARVDEMDKELLGIMYQAGCRWIGYGIESGSQAILNAMNKKVDLARVEQSLRETAEAGIYPNTTFIFGYPGETPETVDETVNFCKGLALKPTFFYATPYPCTKLWKENLDKLTETAGSEEAFIAKLGNATDYLVNLTAMPDVEFFRQKGRLDELSAN